jgi:hypothetical protein
MEFSVKLARLPDEVNIPDRLKDRFHYDAARGLLTYRGFMTKCTYDEVCKLSDDADYHRAIEKLFVMTSNEVTPRSAFPKVPAAVVVATAGAGLLGVAMWWSLSRHDASPAPPRVDATITTPVSR